MRERGNKPRTLPNKPGGETSERSLLLRLIGKLIALQIQRPIVVLLGVVLVTTPCLLLSLRLGLKTDFAELLPENKQSVLELRRVRKQLPTATTLSIVAKCKDPTALRTFVDALAPRLKALGPTYVTHVDVGVQELNAFVDNNKLLYAPYEDLKELHRQVVDRHDRAIARAMGTSLDEDDDLEEGGSTGAAARGEASLRKKVEELEARLQTSRSHPDGYYRSKDGTAIVVLVKTPIEGSDIAMQQAMLARVKEAIAAVSPTRIAADMTVAFTGDLMTAPENHKTIKDDLTHVGTWGVVLVLGSVFLFFLRFRALIALTITIAVGLVWTFAVARLAVGHLNTSTGFLVSIIAGNGINFGIIYMARYLEARTREKLDVAESIRLAHRQTWLATLAASAMALCAYASLALTNFRGFKHFGIIGGAGMFLCWLATYITTPAILTLSERYWSLSLDDGSLRSRAQASYGLFFGYLTRRIPRLILITGLCSGVLSAVAAVKYFANDPMEYNLRHIGNQPRARTQAQHLSGEVDDIVGRIGQEGMAVLVDRLDQVAPLKVVLEQRRDAVPRADRPFDKVTTILDLLPSQQQDKIAWIEEVARKVRSARARGAFSDADWDQIDKVLPNKELRPLTIADLPTAMVAPFTEVDGTRGRIVYIVPRTDRSVWNARYLHTWADSYRKVVLPNGEVIIGSGRAVIYSDMLRAVAEDAPRAIMASWMGTTLVILLTFGFRRASLAVFGSVLLGTTWLLAFLYVKDIKLNFLNFVALPITLGIGADYATNIMRRLQIEGSCGMSKVVVETGGAVVLCSLTTMLGYIALLFSINQAIVSFGTAAAVGELACLCAALLVFPSAVLWLDSRRGAGGSRPTQGALRREP